MSEFKKPSTPKRKAEHRKQLEQVLIDHGFKQDRYGNWIRPVEPDVRVKFKSVNVRIERKISTGWISTGNSFVISQLDPAEWERRIKIRTAAPKGRDAV